MEAGRASYMSTQRNSERDFFILVFDAPKIAGSGPAQLSAKDT